MLVHLLASKFLHAVTPYSWVLQYFFLKRKKKKYRTYLKVRFSLKGFGICFPAVLPYPHLEQALKIIHFQDHVTYCSRDNLTIFILGPRKK